MAATDIRLLLNGVDASAGQVLAGLDKGDTRAQVYAIQDLEIGGVCKCNGHAGKCTLNAQGSYVCDCQHQTTGPDCDRCAPFFKDRPWKRAQLDNANECRSEYGMVSFLMQLKQHTVLYLLKVYVIKPSKNYCY